MGDKATSARARWIDPDYRAKPCARPCVRCGRSIRSHRSEVAFKVFYMGPWVLHPDDVRDDEAPTSLLTEAGEVVADSLEGLSVLVGEIGSTCAKRIGTDWIHWVFRRAW